MERILRSGPVQILIDSRLGVEPEPHWFEPDWWRGRDAVTAELGGRGQALALITPFGDAVLRRYQRGGMVRHLTRRHYLYTGAARTRPFAEWRVTRRLRQLEIPVPQPLAAAFERHGATYCGALLTRRIPDARPLTQAAPDMRASDWRHLGELLGRAAGAGLRHPDLNAGNILIDDDRRFWLLDFDRATIARRALGPGPMIDRLERSLAKLDIAHDANALHSGAAGSENL